MRIILSLMEVLWCHMGIKLEAYGGYTGVMWGSPQPPGTSTSTLSSSLSSPPSSVLPPPLPPPPPPQASPPLPRSLPTHCIAGAVGCPCLRAPRRQGGEQGLLKPSSGQPMERIGLCSSEENVLKVHLLLKLPHLHLHLHPLQPLHHHHPLHPMGIIY